MEKNEKAVERDLKKLTREELLELLLSSEKKNKELQAELASEQEASRQLHDQLKKREMDVEEAGNLAEAALKINGVYEAAQKAAEDYLLNIRTLTQKQEAICSEREEKSKAETSKLMKDTIRQCEELQKKTEEECWNMEENTKEACERVKAAARTEVETYWSELSIKMEEFYKAHEGMKEILSFYNMKLPSIGSQTNS